MNRTATRIALVTLGLATLAACIVNLSFAMDKPGVVLQTAGGSTTVNQQTTQVDLADYPDITSHKNSIKSLDLDYLDVTITAVGADNTATTVTGDIKLRKSLTDTTEVPVDVGSLTNFPIQVGKTTRISGTPALDAFLFQQLQDAGTFYVVVSGSIDHGTADVTLDLNLHASIGYDAGIF